jgi:hypothetical protein
MINLDDGLILIGPGSEWFWAAFQGVVVAVTLWALFRQVRLQTAQKMRDDVAALDAEWDSERMLRYRLVVAIAQRDGTPPEGLPRGAPGAIANFWEEVGSFTRGKYLNKKLLAGQMGPWACWSWQALEPFVHLMRQEYSDEAFVDFEWFVHEVVRLHPELATDLAPAPSGYARRVETLEGLVAVETELRS